MSVVASPVKVLYPTKGNWIIVWTDTANSVGELTDHSHRGQPLSKWVSCDWLISSHLPSQWNSTIQILKGGAKISHNIEETSSWNGK